MNWSILDKNDPLAMVSFDEEAYQEAERYLKNRLKRGQLDRRVCACGHPIARHKLNEFNGKHSCQLPNVGSTCSCRTPRPVLEVYSTKRFLAKPIKDIGPSGHPLLRGIRAVRDKSQEEYEQIEWLIPFTCDKCGSEDVKITPIGYNTEAQMYADKNGDGDITVFLCDACRYPTETSEQPVIDSEGDN